MPPTKLAIAIAGVGVACTGEITGVGVEADPVGEPATSSHIEPIRPDGITTPDLPEPDPEAELTGFGYPVGDRTSYPAGGWTVLQVLGNYNPSWGGRHMAQDLWHPGGGVATIDEPVFSVADGVVRYAGTNGSTYRHVVLIEHELGNGTSVCSFYGHITAPTVQTGDEVVRGQELATVMDWAVAAPGGPSSNTHLHYVLLSKELCDASASAGGALICGYDDGLESGIHDLDTEPYTYTSVGDPCNDHLYPDSFISPTQFIENHHFGVVE